MAFKPSDTTAMTINGHTVAVKTNRCLAKYVGKGDCYEANFNLMLQLDADDIECVLCHGILTAAPFYQHMKPGTQFLHAWVEAKHPKMGWTIADNSLGELTFNTSDMFYDVMTPKAVVKMLPKQAAFHAARWQRYSQWFLHPAHSKEWIK